MSQKQLTESEARSLANKIRGNLVDLEKNLKEFHALQGWLPLGYDSFTVWWDNEMRDLPISNAVRNWAVFAMIEENTVGGRILPGMRPVMAHATGLAPTTITAMRHKVRPRTRHLGKRDSDPAPFSLVMPTLWHRHLMSMSIRKDMPMADFVRMFIKEGMMRHYGVDVDKPLTGE